jgi:hypothetical protein
VSGDALDETLRLAQLRDLVAGIGPGGPGGRRRLVSHAPEASAMALTKN